MQVDPSPSASGHFRRDAHIVPRLDTAQAEESLCDRGARRKRGR